MSPNLFIPGGPARYEHQKRGLHKLLETRGVTALVFDPGLGKTAVAVDYASLLALKSPSGEARVLVVCPWTALDTWVIQTAKFASPQVNFWAEALAGSSLTIMERGAALADRGGRPFRLTPSKTDYLSAVDTLRRRPRETALVTVRKAGDSAPRALWRELSPALETRPTLGPSVGPEALPCPRIVLEVLNLDTFARRTPINSTAKRNLPLPDYLLDSVRRFKPDLIVLDESHLIKGVSSNASRLLARMGDEIPRRIIMTGTVMPHSPLDVFAQWRFLEPFAFGSTDPKTGRRKRATYGRFKERYAVWGGWDNRQPVKFINLDEMQAIMARNAVVAKKETSLDLPETTDIVVPVELSAKERGAYAGMKSKLMSVMLAEGTSATVPNKLTQIMRLRQITCGYLEDDAGKLHILGDSRARTIVSLVNDTLTSEKRIVIFCYFTREIDNLVKLLQDSLDKTDNTEVLRIEGSTPNSERMRIRQRFGSDEDKRLVLVAQIKTLSLAVNELVTASHAIFGALSLQRDDYEQARDRLHRIGQKLPVTFWLTVPPRTVDETILTAHQRREDVETAILRDIMKEGESK